MDVLHKSQVPLLALGLSILSIMGACSEESPSKSQVQATTTRSETCAIFPADNPWNTDISGHSVHADSDLYMARLGATWGLTLFDNLPINVIDSTADNIPLVEIYFDQYTGDPGPMPIPIDAVYHIKDPTKLVTEDNHLVLVDNADCTLYELWSVDGASSDGSWTVGSSSVFDLTSNALRADETASSAASGLPVFAGIARADEVQAGVITHALAIPATFTYEGYIRPATNYQPDAVYEYKIPLVCAAPDFEFASLCDEIAAGTFPLSDPYNSPMGLRLRLKADFDISGYTGEAAILLQAAKTYGLIVSDGSGTTGVMRGELVQDPEVWDWSNTINSQLATVPATAFEVVDTGSVLP